MQNLSSKQRTERRAIVGQRPTLFGRRIQSAGTECVRPQFAKPARIPPGDRQTDPFGEGQP